MREPSTLRAWRAVHHGALLLLLAAGNLITVGAVVQVCRYREIVEHYFGIGSVFLYVWMSICLVLGIIAILRLVRSWYRGKWERCTPAPFRWLFCCLTLFALAKVLFIGPTNYTLVALTLASGFGAWSILLLTEKRILPSRTFRAVDIVLFLVCLTAFTAETGLRYMERHYPSPLLSRSSDDVLRVLKKFRYPPGKVRFGFPCNRSGHYDTEFHPKREGKLLVVCIGDSFSAGVVPHYHHFTTVCERELPGCTVYNMGIPCIGPNEYLYLLKYEALKLDPDLVIIDIFAGNDIGCCRRESWKTPFLLSWFSGTQAFVALLPVRLARIARECFSTGRMPGELKGEYATEELCLSPTEIQARFPWVADVMMEEPNHALDWIMDVEYKLAPTVVNPSMRDDYHFFFLVMEAIRETSAGVPLAVMIIPDQLQVEEDIWRAVCERYQGTDLDRSCAQKRIKEWLKRKGIPFLDLLPLLRAIPPLKDGERHLYHLGDTHFNVRGNEAAGKALAAFIEKLDCSRNR